MSAAALFAVCFVACLFAFVVVAVTIWQASRFLIGRALKRDPSIFLNGILAVPEGERMILESLHRHAAHRPHGVLVPDGEFGAMCDVCKRTQPMPVMPRAEADRALVGMGWRLDPDPDSEHATCPDCVRANVKDVA